MNQPKTPPSPRQQQPVSPAVLACVCGWQGEDVRTVRMRVDGRATAYHLDRVPMCRSCRDSARGRWMYAERS